MSKMFANYGNFGIRGIIRVALLMSLGTTDHTMTGLDVGYALSR
jgi:hypothetical protein